MARLFLTKTLYRVGSSGLPVKPKARVLDNPMIGQRVEGTTSCLIWDSAGIPPTEERGKTVLWRAFVNSYESAYLSIPQLIEENAETLRARYLSCVCQLGETRIHGLRLIDHMRLHSDFSYWWLTLIAEKCNYNKSLHITDVIGLFAFTDWASSQRLDGITLISANSSLAASLRDWCENRAIKFLWRAPATSELTRSPGRVAYDALPRAMRSMVWLVRYLIARWPLRGVGCTEWLNSKGTTTFVTYLFNLDRDATLNSRYKSPYWGPLPNILGREAVKVNWLHLYVQDDLLPSAKEAAARIEAFNTEEPKQVHTTLDSFLCFRVIFEVLLEWSKLAWRGARLRASVAASCRMSIDFWPFFKNDWEESTTGVTAMSNVLFAKLFSVALNKIPKQNLGIYLQENQGWELSLIQNWRIANHGRIIGVPHSSVRFWDLRYFIDPGIFHDVEKKYPPLPDKVAINGPAANNSYVAAGYPKGQLVQVEALRYLYLNKFKRRIIYGDLDEEGEVFHLLVFGDYLARNTRIQINLLAQVADFLPSRTKITVKPHPACPVDPEEYPELSINISFGPVGDLLADCDAAYVSATTTAGLDAFCADVPVISLVDPTTLNMNPLRGYPGVCFVSSSNELIKAIHLALTVGSRKSNAEHMFHLNEGLPYWRELLGLKPQAN